MKKNKKPDKNRKDQAIRDEKGRWKPGVSGNEDGRPEGSGQPFSLKVMLEKEIQKCPEGQDKKSFALLLIVRMLRQAIQEGDFQMIKLIWNYLEGMPKESTDITTKGESINPLMPGDEVPEEDKQAVEDFHNKLKANMLKRFLKEEKGRRHTR